MARSTNAQAGLEIYVEQVQGTIRVDSHLGKGACFTISLPRYNGTASS